MNVLVVDVGGSSVKILATGQDEARKFSSGPEMTAAQMVASVKALAGDWEYEAVSIGYPGRASRDRVASDPHNLSPGWVGFDFQSAFGCPVRLSNDAAMQALGSYRGGKLLFLGLGTGLGSAMVVDGMIMPMELACGRKASGQMSAMKNGRVANERSTNVTLTSSNRSSTKRRYPCKSE